MRACFFLIVLITLGHGGFAQSKKSRRLPDKVILVSGDSETGRVTESDSSRIILCKGDYSEKTIPWKNIDTIVGLSYASLFLCPSLGIGNISYFSTFRYDQVRSSGAILQLRVGKLRKKHWSSYLQLSEMPVKPYNVLKLGTGFNYYLFNGYTENLCPYLGAKFEMTAVETNKSPFFNYGLHIGLEYNTRNNNRYFCELTHQKTIFNIHNGRGLTFAMGIRFSKEYNQRYKRLNTLRKL